MPSWSGWRPNEGLSKLNKDNKGLIYEFTQSYCFCAFTAHTHGYAVFVIYDPPPESPASGRGVVSTCGGNRGFYTLCKIG